LRSGPDNHLSGVTLQTRKLEGALTRIVDGRRKVECVAIDIPARKSEFAHLMRLKLTDRDIAAMARYGKRGLEIAQRVRESLCVL
jgi:hypothetical protein